MAKSPYVLLDTPILSAQLFIAMHNPGARYPHAMAVTTAPARDKRRSSSAATGRKRKNKKNPGWLAVWWPLLLGIVVTPFTIHAASIMALAGPSALMTLYPWVLLLKSPFLGLANMLGDDLSQLLMYIQFPIYGLIMALLLRSKALWSALAGVALIHILAILGIFFLKGRIP